MGDRGREGEGERAPQMAEYPPRLRLEKGKGVLSWACMGGGYKKGGCKRCMVILPGLIGCYCAASKQSTSLVQSLVLFICGYLKRSFLVVPPRNTLCCLFLQRMPCMTNERAPGRGQRERASEIVGGMLSSPASKAQTTAEAAEKKRLRRRLQPPLSPLLRHKRPCEGRARS